MSEPTRVASEYIAARTVLLDALEALAPHKAALVVVGAQAVYLRTGAAGLTVAPFTTDGDVALDPTALGDDPALEAAMTAGGFRLYERDGQGIEPGTWVGDVVVDGRVHRVPVDLIVPAGVIAGGNTRGARLPAHGKRAAKRTYGLEAAIFDNDVLAIEGLAHSDERVIRVAVAGPAALLVAKVIKLADRVDDATRPHRQRDKDAGDVLRLVRAVPVRVMVERLRILADHPTAGGVTQDALGKLSRLFGAPAAPGVAMAVRSVELDVARDEVEAQLPAYVREVRRRLAG